MQKRKIIVYSSIWTMCYLQNLSLRDLPVHFANKGPLRKYAKIARMHWHGISGKKPGQTTQSFVQYK